MCVASGFKTYFSFLGVSDVLNHDNHFVFFLFPVTDQIHELGYDLLRL